MEWLKMIPTPAVCFVGLYLMPQRIYGLWNRLAEAQISYYLALPMLAERWVGPECQRCLKPLHFGLPAPVCWWSAVMRMWQRRFQSRKDAKHKRLGDLECTLCALCAGKQHPGWRSRQAEITLCTSAGATYSLTYNDLNAIVKSNEAKWFEKNTSFFQEKH